MTTFLPFSWHCSWADFLPYGRALSWQLSEYVPPGKTESSPRYPSGWLHGIFRVALYPVLFAVFAGLVLTGVLKRSYFPTAATTAEKTAVPNEAAPVPAKPARFGTPVEEARVSFRSAQAIAGPIEMKLAIPARGVPAKQTRQINGQSATVVVAYADEVTCRRGFPTS